MRFPVIAAALVVLGCAVALPTPPTLKQSEEAPGGKTAGDEPRASTGHVTIKNVQSTPTSTEVLVSTVTPTAASRPAAKTVTVNAAGLPASSLDADKQLTETSFPASDNTEKSDEKSSAATAKSSSKPTEGAKAAGAASQSRTSDQPLLESVNPPAQTTIKTTPQPSALDQPLSKSVSSAAGRVQSTKPSDESQGGSGKPKRAVVKPSGLARTTNIKAKSPLVKSVEHLTNRHPAGHAARTEPTTNSKRSLPQTNAAFRAGSAATRRAPTPTITSQAPPPKTSEHSRKAELRSQTSTKAAGAARGNGDGVESTARPARAVVQPQLFAKPRDSRAAITKAPSKTTPRPVLPENDDSHATKGETGVSKHKRPTRAANPPATQVPKETSTTQATIEPSEKTTEQLNISTSAIDKTAKIETEPESSVNLNMKNPTSLSDVLNEMVKALISTSEIAKATERSSTVNAFVSDVPQSTDTVKTTPPISTTESPICVTAATTRKTSYQGESSTGKARIIPGLVDESVATIDIYDATTSPVAGAASTVGSLAAAKSATLTQPAPQRAP